MLQFTSSTALLVPVLLALPGGSLGLQEPEAPPVAVAETVDLSLVVAEGRKVLVELERDFQGTATMRMGGGSMEQEIDAEEDLVFVDECTVVQHPEGDEGGLYETTRRYLQWHETVNGRVTDPELSGVEVRLIEEGGELNLETANRTASSANLQKLLDQIQAAGLWCSLPTEAEFGVPFEFAPTSLIYLLLDTNGELLSAEGSLVLDSLGEDNVATLSGSLSARELEEEEGGNVESSYEGELRLSVDVPNGVLLGLEWVGTSTVSGDPGGIELEAEGDFQIRLTGEIGPQAERAWKRKTKYRDCEWELGALGLKFELPSYFFEVDSEEGWLYETTFETDWEPVSIHVMAYGLDGVTFEEFLDGFESGLEGEADFKSGKASCPLGKGRDYEFETDAGEFEAAVFPLGRDRVLVVRMYGTSLAMKKSGGTFRDFVSTLDEVG